MRTIAIIQARTRSTRLPGKILRTLGAETVIEAVHRRVAQTQGLDTVVIALPEGPADDALAEHVASFCGNVVRGSEADVLSRYAKAAAAYPSENYVRVTSDCPFFDPDILAAMLRKFEGLEADYMSNTLDPHLPRGLDAEVFTSAALRQAADEAQEPHEREHVTPYLYLNSDRFTIASFRERASDHSDLRWTLDTPEDWELISTLFDLLPIPFSDARLDDFLALYDGRPHLREINAAIEQKKLKG